MNSIGKVAEKCWLEIPKHFPNVELDIFQIMPNHIHFILRILDCRGAINRAPTDAVNGGFASRKSPMLNPNSLSKIIRWFKGRTTFEIHKLGFNFQWQRNFYEHIIRNEKSYNEIYAYIESNPQMWDRDKDNPAYS